MGCGACKQRQVSRIIPVSSTKSATSNAKKQQTIASVKTGGKNLRELLRFNGR